jgi:isopenicillin-N N-acyltransferase-like protein
MSAAAASSASARPNGAASLPTTAVPHLVPIIRVAGSHRQVGEQIGEAVAQTVREAVESPPVSLPSGRTFDQQLALAAQYRTVTQRHLPWVVEEMDGVAAAAGVDPLTLFAHSIEEIWYEPYAAAARGRCSDLIAVAPASASGHVLAAHNNDLAPTEEPGTVAIEWRVDGEPVVFTLGIGPWISVGWNDAGLWLGGNELAPNDERVGIPRLLQVRDCLTRRTPDDAMRAALHPERASSYNWVFAHATQGVVNVEGSATSAAVTRPDERGLLAHTNHYVHPDMLEFEGDHEYAGRSDARYREACRMLAEAPAGKITTDGLRDMLSDHTGAPDSVCRHPDPAAGAQSKTVFWCVSDLTDGEIEFGRGNPCNSTAQPYRFA